MFELVEGYSGGARDVELTLCQGAGSYARGSADTGESAPAHWLRWPARLAAVATYCLHACLPGLASCLRGWLLARAARPCPRLRPSPNKERTLDPLTSERCSPDFSTLNHTPLRL